MRPKDNTYIFEKPIYYSELKKLHPDKKDMAKYLLERTNNLGKIDLETIK